MRSLYAFIALAACGGGGEYAPRTVPNYQPGPVVDVVLAHVGCAPW